MIGISYPVQYSTVPKYLSDFINNNSKIWNGKKGFITETMVFCFAKNTGDTSFIMIPPCLSKVKPPSLSNLISFLRFIYNSCTSFTYTQ